MNPQQPGPVTVGRIVLDAHVKLWRGARYLTGGAPWTATALSTEARELVRRLRAAGRSGLVPGAAEQQAAAEMLDAGIVHPIPAAGPVGRGLADVEVVVPCHGTPEALAACLARLPNLLVTVVDDASPDPVGIERVAQEYGATVVRHPVNRGPAAARNTGLAHTRAPIVAFLDLDCLATPGWVEALLPHFADPRLGAIGPRIRPAPPGSATLILQHETVRSALDMGPHPQLVRYGSPVGFLPTAALLVRRKALPAGGFSSDMRVGEDVDLVWRLVAGGWRVRYDPRVVVHHLTRDTAPAWVGRRFEYGTSAPALDQRHPRRPAPAELSVWNVAALLCLGRGKPRLAATLFTLSALAVAGEFHRAGLPWWLGCYATGKGLVSDVRMIGQALRREWWPLSAVAVAFPRSGVARLALIAAAGPLVAELRRPRPPHGRGAYLLLVLVEDIAYGTGVWCSAVISRRLRVVWPRWRRSLPPRRRKRAAP